MSRFRLTLSPHDWVADLPTRLSLLAGAASVGWVLPSSCRNGSCRACMCRLTSGKVRYDIEWPGLSREEKLEGYILPCVAFADAEDLVLEAPNATRRP